MCQTKEVEASICLLVLNSYCFLILYLLQEIWSNTGCFKYRIFILSYVMGLRGLVRWRDGWHLNLFTSTLNMVIAIYVHRMFLGSVSNYCTNHVQCPVIIVKGKGTAWLAKIGMNLSTILWEVAAAFCIVIYLSFIVLIIILILV